MRERESKRERKKKKERMKQRVRENKTIQKIKKLNSKITKLLESNYLESRDTSTIIIINLYKKRMKTSISS